MKPKNKSLEPSTTKKTSSAADKTVPDNDADKTGTDTNSDKTQIPGTKNGKSESKFDKPGREANPDTTGIDTNSDKTKKESLASRLSTAIFIKTQTTGETGASIN